MQKKVVIRRDIRRFIFKSPWHGHPGHVWFPATYPQPLTPDRAEGLLPDTEVDDCRVPCKHGDRVAQPLLAVAFPSHAGIDTYVLVLWGKFQISSKQDWERGLRGGEIDGNTRCHIRVLIAVKGANAGTDTLPE